MSSLEAAIIPETHKTSTCYHCGEKNPNNALLFDEKQFCCNGCLSVYQLLNQAGLCAYYDLNEAAGINKRQTVRADKFAYLEDESIQQTLISFKNETETHVTFYVPLIHCSSCVYLLERLHQLHPGVIRVDIQFLKKEVAIIFNNQQTTLRTVVEAMTSLGYEPHISLQQMQKKQPKVNRSLIYRLGVAGFAFGNIMLLSFPEYLTSDAAKVTSYTMIFRYLSLALGIPVFFYSAMEFFIAAWKGLKQKFINIDAPVSLAVITCFVRSVYDILTGAGPGYLDSMAGIVFFMLVGKVLQAKTYGQLSFERDYTDYFPIAASVVKDNAVVPTPLTKVKVNDTIRIHNNELIPADGILVAGKAQVDYSFVTGESKPVEVPMGAIIYAGGKQLGADIEIMTIKEVAHSYLTSLWNKNKDIEKSDEEINKRSSVHYIGKFFTLEILVIAFAALGYWSWKGDYNLMWESFTAVLIVACPCALLLTSTFTNGYLLRILERNGLFLRTAKMIEPLGELQEIVFDKTGTLTSSKSIKAEYIGPELTDYTKKLIASLTVPSMHPMAKPVYELMQVKEVFHVEDFKEFPSLGVSGYVEGFLLEIGTATHLGLTEETAAKATVLWIRIDGQVVGQLELFQGLRSGVQHMFRSLAAKLTCTLLSGDNTHQQAYLKQELGADIALHFNQQPADKLNYIKARQASHIKVGMIGDGLNDAGALRQSDVGISIAEDINSFTPAADAILEGKDLSKLEQLIRLCSKGKSIVKMCFIFSLIYNLTGVYFAVQGLLSPLIAAILMPLSTLTIVLITYGVSNTLAKRYGLK